MTSRDNNFTYVRWRQVTLRSVAQRRCVQPLRRVCISSLGLCGSAPRSGQGNSVCPLRSPSQEAAAEHGQQRRRVRLLVQRWAAQTALFLDLLSGVSREEGPENVSMMLTQQQQRFVEQQLLRLLSPAWPHLYCHFRLLNASFLCFICFKTTNVTVQKPGLCVVLAWQAKTAAAEIHCHSC